MITVDDIKAFAEAKQKETRGELEFALKKQQEDYYAWKSAVAETQRAFRAYTSILEIIAGEHPCDPIHKSDDDE